MTATTSPAPGTQFGSGLGTLIGGMLADESLGDGLDRVKTAAQGFDNKTQPYNEFGLSFLEPTTAAVHGINTVAGTTKGYDQFMQDYTNTPAVQYQLQQADARRTSSAAARGGILSGANMRAASEIDNGIIAQGANTAYDKYLAGSNVQFGQLEAALGNMFKAIGVGQTATGQQAGVTSTQMAADAALAQAQAKNDQSKGSGIGSMFSGLGSFATLF